jgi:hypothetical protein
MRVVFHQSHSQEDKKKWPGALLKCLWQHERDRRTDERTTDLAETEWKQQPTTLIQIALALTHKTPPPVDSRSWPSMGEALRDFSARTYSTTSSRISASKSPTISIDTVSGWPLGSYGYP